MTTRPYSHTERLRVIHGVLLCILLVAIDQTVVLPAIPQMAKTLHGARHLAWVVSAYLLASTATTPIYGKLSDQFGRAKILVPCLLEFMLASIACAFAPNIPVLLLGRALQGLGGGALLAVSQSAVADVVPPRERGRYQVWFASMWMLASSAGPVIGGYLSQHFSWRLIFWANIPLGLLALALCLRGLKNLPIAGQRGKIDLAGAFLLMSSSTLILVVLSLGGTDLPWLSWPEAGLAGLSALGFFCFYLQQRFTPAPLLPGGLLKRLKTVIAVGWLNTCAMFAGIFTFPMLFHGIFHESASRTGLAMVPFLVSATIGAYLAGQTLQRTGKVRPVLAVGLLISTLCTASLAFSPTFAPIFLSGLFGVGLGMINPTTLMAAQSLAKPPEVGIATGMLLLLRSMGGAFGATLAGVLLNGGIQTSLNDFRLSFSLCLILTLAGLLAVLLSPEIHLRGEISLPSNTQTPTK